MKRAVGNSVLMRKLDRQRRRPQREEGCKFLPIPPEIVADEFGTLEELLDEIMASFALPRCLVMPPAGRVSYPHPAGGKFNGR